MFRGQRHRVRILFGTADVLLIAAAFGLAYAIRARLDLEHEFYILRGAAKDSYLLALAEASQAEFLVTGDKELLSLKQHKSTRMVTPTAMLEFL